MFGRQRRAKGKIRPGRQAKAREQFRRSAGRTRQLLHRKESEETRHSNLTSITSAGATMRGRRAAPARPEEGRPANIFSPEQPGKHRRGAAIARNYLVTNLGDCRETGNVIVTPA